ncbi:MAG: hypothetical protein AB7E49_06830 [Campylobacterales bacterium]
MVVSSAASATPQFHDAPRQSAAAPRQTSANSTPAVQVFAPATVQNPYAAQGVPDAVYEAFESVAKRSEPMVVADMKIRFFEQAARQSATQNDYVERAWIMREHNAAVMTRQSAQEAVKAQNIMLAARGQPPMMPAEEQMLVSRIQMMAKLKVRFLDGFIGAMQGDVLEAVA